MTGFTSIGWYGKIPSHGDFLNIRLPRNFVTSWSTWINEAIVSSRADLGDRWLDLYFLLRPWRYFLPRNLIDENLWLGILAHSLDSVGRCYPVTLVSSVSAEEAMVIDHFAWFQRLETFTSKIVDDRLDQNSIENEITHLNATETKNWETKICTVELPDAARLHSVSREVIDSMLLEIASNASTNSLWWTPSVEGNFTLLSTSGWPSTNSFVDMMQLPTSRQSQSPK